MFYMEME